MPQAANGSFGNDVNNHPLLMNRKGKRQDSFKKAHSDSACTIDLKTSLA